jgi:DNA repair protein RecN (Recombination protein N)
MILELQVQDFALIDKLNVGFNKGLNILTGETGAGKSIIIDAVNFVLGERSSKDIVRTGADRAEVQAVFECVQNNEVIKIMNENGIECDEGVVILSRELSTYGRSICRINGKLVTTSILKSIGNFLIDIHGQHEHQSLLNETHHIDMLDMFGGCELSYIKSEVYKAYSDVGALKRQLKSIMGDDIERERKLNLLKFQIKESG